MDAFVISSLPSLVSEKLQTAGPLRYSDITPPPRYCGPIRHPLDFDRLPNRRDRFAFDKNIGYIVVDGGYYSAGFD